MKVWTVCSGCRERQFTEDIDRITESAAEIGEGGLGISVKSRDPEAPAAHPLVAVETGYNLLHYFEG